MHKSVQLLSVLVIVALAFVVSACGSKVGRVCSHLESLADGDLETDGDATCEESIAELEEACPEAFEATLDCVLEADTEDDAGGCLLVCALAQMAE